jgi:hypothetical protein
MDITAMQEDARWLLLVFTCPRRFEDIVAIDFFTSPLRARAEDALAQAEQTGAMHNVHNRGSASEAKYQKRTWITRLRPGIDRVSSARLLSRFIDAKPKFITKPARNISGHGRA